MKIITYKATGYTTVYNSKTVREEQQEIVVTVTVECPTQADYNANYKIAEAEALPGTIEVSGEFDPEPAEPAQEDRIKDLEEALEMLLNGVTE